MESKPEISPIENNKGGVIARDGMIHQDIYLVNDLIINFSNPNFMCAYVEFHEDYILIFNNCIRLYQVKMRESHLDKWSLNKEFCENIIKPFYDTLTSITSEKNKECHFLSNMGINSGSKQSLNLHEWFKISKKSKAILTQEEVDYLNNVYEKIKSYLKITEKDEILKELVYNFHYKNTDSYSSMIRASRDLLQDQLKPFAVSYDQIKILVERLINLVSTCGAEENEIELSKVNEIYNSDKSYEEKLITISEIKRCITRSKILELLIFPESPFKGKIKFFEKPTQELNFQKMMNLANIPEKIIDVALQEYFNADYHRKLVTEILGDTGNNLIDSTKGEVYSIWGEKYSENYDKNEEDFGIAVFGDCSKKIREDIDNNKLVNPVIQNPVHIKGLLHELAEEEKVTYLKENGKQ
jgi:hypothetical protein